MDITKEDVFARKAWFCFPGGVVCVGSQIRGGAGAPLYTDVNQCLLRGPVGRLGSSGVVHDGVGYVFLQPTTWRDSEGPQTGSWALLRKEGVSHKPVTRDVFNLWIDHGSNPGGATYAYAILPRTSRADLAAFIEHPAYRVVENGANQIVADETDGILAAVFHERGTAPAAAGVEGFQVDRPCIVIASRIAGRTTYAVSDPTQKQSEVILTSAGGHARHIRLPQGGYAGSTVTVN